MKTLFFPLVLLLLSGALDAAQLYRWVDEKGNVEWRDTPPPATAKKVEQRKIGDNTVDTSELPYSVQRAVKNHPVTLWTNDCGEVCTRAREHLNRRGVPYTERHPVRELAAFKKASGGDMDVPLLFVGNWRSKGYLESEWDAALDAAGYPSTPAPGARPVAKSKPDPSEPVVLYTNAKCVEPCNEARELLRSRGIKFQEMTTDAMTSPEDATRAKAIGARVPVLMIGQFVVSGFDAASYHKALDGAGYRRTAQ